MQVQNEILKQSLIEKDYKMNRYDKENINLQNNWLAEAYLKKVKIQNIN